VTTDTPLPDEPREPTERQRSRERKPTARRDRWRLILGIVIGVIATVFAFLNLDETEVNWIIGTWNTPVIVVIAVSFVIGVIADRVWGTVHRRRKRSESASSSRESRGARA
jgi:uncharacterized integral membrane protein